MTHPFHAKLETLGHKLRRDQDGNIDDFVLEVDNHNGPGCELCGESWCHHCGGDIEPCGLKPPAPASADKNDLPQGNQDSSDQSKY